MCFYSTTTAAAGDGYDGDGDGGCVFRQRVKGYFFNNKTIVL